MNSHILINWNFLIRAVTSLFLFFSLFPLSLPPPLSIFVKAFNNLKSFNLEGCF